MRNCPYRSDIRRHVLANLAIATRSGHLEAPVFIADTDRQAIELEFGHVLERRPLRSDAQIAARTGVEFGRSGGSRIGLRANRQHRHGVSNRRELG